MAVLQRIFRISLLPYRRTNPEFCDAMEALFNADCAAQPRLLGRLRVLHHMTTDIRRIKPNQGMIPRFGDVFPQFLARTWYIWGGWLLAALLLFGWIAWANWPADPAQAAAQAHHECDVSAGAASAATSLPTEQLLPTDQGVIQAEHSPAPNATPTAQPPTPTPAPSLTPPATRRPHTTAGAATAAPNLAATPTLGQTLAPPTAEPSPVPSSAAPTETPSPAPQRPRRTATPASTAPPTTTPTPELSSTAAPPTHQPTRTVMPTPGEENTPTQTSEPTQTVTPTPSEESTPTREPTRTATPTQTPEPARTVTPTPGEDGTATAVPPTVPPTATPTCEPGDHRRVDVMLTIDRSASMAGQKLQKAQEAAATFISLLNPAQDQIGLVTFAGSAEVKQRLSPDGAAVIEKIAQITPASKTNMASAIISATAELTSTSHQAGALQVIILLSDGRTDEQPAKDAAATARALGVRLITIGLGENVNEDLMREIASRPSDYHYAPAPEQLEEIYISIAGTVHTCGEVKSQNATPFPSPSPTPASTTTPASTPSAPPLNDKPLPTPPSPPEASPSAVPGPTELPPPEDQPSAEPALP